ncbi:hypothetical protein PUN28_017322 [Cardiocondyla obscurior]|uniref:Uncharacterized protein n=1 Tax=Cardiocondyla obscurior TaxID=286306 RepID=A0AAW2ENN4_9HYME
MPGGFGCAFTRHSVARGFAVATTIDLHADTRPRFTDARPHTHARISGARVRMQCTDVSPASPARGITLSVDRIQSVIVVPPRCFSRRLQHDLSGNWDSRPPPPLPPLPPPPSHPMRIESDCRCRAGIRLDDRRDPGIIDVANAMRFSKRRFRYRGNAENARNV